MTLCQVLKPAVAGLLSCIATIFVAYADVKVQPREKAVPQFRKPVLGSQPRTDPFRGNQEYGEEMLEDLFEQTRPEGIGDEEYYEFIYKEKLLYTDEGEVLK